MARTIRRQLLIDNIMNTLEWAQTLWTKESKDFYDLLLQKNILQKITPVMDGVFTSRAANHLFDVNTTRQNVLYKDGAVLFHNNNVAIKLLILFKTCTSWRSDTLLLLYPPEWKVLMKMIGRILVNQLNICMETSSCHQFCKSIICNPLNGCLVESFLYMRTCIVTNMKLWFFEEISYMHHQLRRT